ncbi:MAG: TlpA disulfide reductase family protein [Myxococcota bacterium]
MRGVVSLLSVLLLAGGCEAGSVPSPNAPGPEAAPEAAAAAFPTSRSGTELVGTPAPPLSENLKWINGDPLTLESLRGKVVLVRFWTNTCPFCAASAPGLTQLHERYADQGLVVLGLFHPKPRGSAVEVEAISARAKELGMPFAIASDESWETLDRWWLNNGERGRAATSVSFLLDAEGTIRWIHPGPEFHPEGPEEHEQCRADFDDAVRAIDGLLAERRPSAS